LSLGLLLSPLGRREVGGRVLGGESGEQEADGLRILAFLWRAAKTESVVQFRVVGTEGQRAPEGPTSFLLPPCLAEGESGEVVRVAMARA
jgi:hypothetical protein